MVGTKGRQQQNNKGVNFTRGDLNQATSVSDSEGCNTPGTTCCKSLNKVKHEVRTVIELMGPPTPNFDQSSSNNADNEDSIFSNSTFATHEDRSEVATDPLMSECNNSTVPPDISLQDDSSTAKDSSLVVDKPSTMVDLPECICPPPELPTNFVFNSECMCPQIASYIQKENVKEETAAPNKSKNKIQSFLRSITDKRSSSQTKKSEYYTINMKKSHSRDGIPERLVFDLVEALPKSSEHQCQCGVFDEKLMRCNEVLDDDCKKTKNLKNKHLYDEYRFNSGIIQGKQIADEQKMYREEIPPNTNEPRPKFYKNNEKYKTSHTESNGATRVDVYYFDHGNPSYFRTTDRPPIVTTEAMAEKTEAYTTKFWAEIFGSFHIGFSFITSFILQAVRFLLYSIIRPLTVGLIQLISDYLFKPLLATIFNSCIQPPLTFLYNIASSMRDLCDPIAEGIGYFIRECAVLIRAFRIVEVKHEKFCQSCRGDTISDRKCRII